MVVMVFAGRRTRSRITRLTAPVLSLDRPESRLLDRWNPLREYLDRSSNIEYDPMDKVARRRIGVLYDQSD